MFRRSLTAPLLQPIGSLSQQFYLIDIARGLAALTIIIFHYKNFLKGTHDEGLELADLTDGALFSFLHPIVTNGSLAVMLFWMISGFVMMLVYSAHGSQIDGRAYTANRLSRLYPLHFATLIYIALIQTLSHWQFGGYQIYTINDLYHFVLQLFFISHFGLEQGLSFNGPIWSVSAEIFAYFVFFLYIRFAPANIASLIVAFLVAMAVYLATKSDLFLCAAYFFGGCMVYAMFFLCRNTSGRAALWGLLLSVIFVFLDQSVARSGISLPLTLRLLGYFGLLIFMLAALEDILVKTPLRHLRFIGDITYSTYLLHTPIQITFLMLVAYGVVELSIILSPVFAVGYFFFVCATSYLVFQRFELPMKRWVRKKLSRA